MNDNKKICKACGLIQADSPSGCCGQCSGSECACCGIRIGHDDSSKEATQNHLKNWIEAGQNWYNPADKPENWDLDVQLKNRPADFT